MIIKAWFTYVNLDRYKKFFFDAYPCFCNLKIILISNECEDEDEDEAEQEEIVDITDEFSEYVEEIGKTGIQDCQEILEHHLRCGKDFCDLPKELKYLYEKRKHPEKFDLNLPV